MSSTFEGLYIARSGVQAARTNLNITGQNISNVNTTGYTRQRVDQSAIPPSAVSMLYAAGKAINGEGVTTTGISQLRNSYLDAQYRTQYAKSGASSTLLSGMSSVEKILNESTTDGLSAQFGNLLTQLQGLTSSGSASSTESTVKNAASLLCTFFNTAANELDATHATQLGYLKDYAVGQANNLMRDISSLNEQIKNANIAGTPALELLDQRNSKLDELSQYVNIKVEEVKSTSTSVKGDPVYDLKVTLVDQDGKAITTDGNALKSDNSNALTLISNDQYRKFNVTTSDATAAATQPYGKTSVSVSDLDNTDKSNLKDANYTVSLTDADFPTGEIHGYLQLLNENGEFDTTTTTRGIGYYKKILDEAAQKFASLMNQANSTNDTQDNKPLFTDSDGNTTDITAANIQAATNWVVGNPSDDSQYGLTTTKKESNSGDDNTAGTDNIESMIRLLEGNDAVTLKANGTNIFTGSMQGAIDDISLKLGQDIGSITSADTANSNTLTNIDTGRLEISSVDINEEAINLIQYNQSLSASARFMTTIDEMLTTIISNMGMAGR